jgi:hypothetical protein
MDIFAQLVAAKVISGVVLSPERLHLTQPLSLSVSLAYSFWVYILNALYAMANPWIDKVDSMEWGLNPMYYVWLYEFDRRRWAAQVTFVVALFAPIAGGYIFYTLTYNAVTFNNASIGFLIGCIFLALLAISWYKGFWKPRTTEVMYGEREALQEKDDEKPADYYFPPRPP